MRSIETILATVAIFATFQASAFAQASSSRSLTPEEVEAYQMSQTLAGSCSPSRHASMQGSSESVIRRPEPLAGTAAFIQSIQGTFLVLEHYDQSLQGHCLVLGRFADSLEAGHYDVRQLADTAMQSEVGTEDHSFYGVFAIRSSAESSVFVAQSGTVDLSTVEAGKAVGTFHMSGFIVQQSTRMRDATLEGSFTALVPPEG